jgi:hypothetical protein
LTKKVPAGKEMFTLGRRFLFDTQIVLWLYHLFIWLLGSIGLSLRQNLIQRELQRILAVE